MAQSERVDEKSLREKRISEKKCWHIRRFLIGTLGKEERDSVFFSK